MVNVKMYSVSLASVTLCLQPLNAEIVELSSAVFMTCFIPENKKKGHTSRDRGCHLFLAAQREDSKRTVTHTYVLTLLFR